MKAVKYYKSRGGLDYALYLMPTAIFALCVFILSLEGYERVQWLNALNAPARREVHWPYTGLLALFSVGVVTLFVSYRVLNDNKGRKAELKISDTGIYCLPMDIHPIEIPWKNIISKPELTKISGKKAIHLKLSDYVLEGYRDELKEIYVDIDRLSANNKEILNSIHQFYKLHSR